MLNDKLWYNDVSILYKDNKYLDFWPYYGQSYNQRINALCRFIIFCGIAISISNNNTNGIIGTLVLLIFVYFSIDKRKSEHCTNLQEYFESNTKDDGKCQLPTKDNPFSNYLIGDNIDRKQACPYGDVKTDIKDKFNEDLYKSVWDVFDKENSQRQFYTMPNTEVCNEQTKYAEWLYGNKFKKTCKTDYKTCTGHENGGAGGGSD